LNIFDLAFGVLVIILTIMAIRLSFQKKLNWSLTNFLIVSVIFIFARQSYQVPLDEMARWIAPLFPIYIVMAIMTERKIGLQRIILAISGISLLLLTAWWSTGRWIG
jgi:hypothetical protein